MGKNPTGWKSESKQHTYQLPGKPVHPEASLRSGSLPKASKHGVAPGNHGAETVPTQAHSNVESLRNGNKPQPESVRQPMQSKSLQTAKAQPHHVAGRNGK